MGLSHAGPSHPQSPGRSPFTAWEAEHEEVTYVAQGHWRVAELGFEPGQESQICVLQSSDRPWVVREA